MRCADINICTPRFYAQKLAVLVCPYTMTGLYCFLLGHFTKHIKTNGKGTDNSSFFRIFAPEYQRRRTSGLEEPAKN